MSYQCSTCGASCDYRPGWCPRCLSQGSYSAAVSTLSRSVLSDTAIRTAEELFRRRGAYLDLPEEIARVVGRLPVTTWSLMIYGPPGAGKSCFALLLADALARSGRVLYDAVEEGFGPAFTDKLRVLEVVSPSIDVISTGSIVDLVGALQQRAYVALFLDSLTQARVDPEDLARLEREAGVSIGWTSQVRKDGAFAGAGALSHYADVVIEIPERGRWRTEKNRYGDCGEGVFS